MICTRFLENKNFVPQKYWQLKLQTTKDNIDVYKRQMQFFKRIILIARNNGILIGDPFANYKIRLEKVRCV